MESEDGMSEKGPRGIDVGHDFLAYLYAHPHERFWQALRNWSGQNFIIAKDSADSRGGHDTFYWHGKGPTA